MIQTAGSALAPFSRPFPMMVLHLDGGIVFRFRVPKPSSIGLDPTGRIGTLGIHPSPPTGLIAHHVLSTHNGPFLVSAEIPVLGTF